MKTSPLGFGSKRKVVSEICFEAEREILENIGQNCNE